MAMPHGNYTCFRPQKPDNESLGLIKRLSSEKENYLHLLSAIIARSGQVTTNQIVLYSVPVARMSCACTTIRS